MHVLLNRILLAAVAVVSLSSSASSALLLSLNPTTTTVAPGGGLATITVNISGDAGEAISGFDIFFDVSTIDLNAAGPHPVAISNIQNLAGFDIFGPLSPGGAGRDFGVSALQLFGLPMPTAGGLDLFSFDATFANPGPTATSFDFTFTPAAVGSGLVINGLPSDPLAPTYTDTTIVVPALAAVPEPSAFAMLGGLAAITGLVRRRRSTSCLESAVAS